MTMRPCRPSDASPRYHVLVHADSRLRRRVATWRGNLGSDQRAQRREVGSARKARRRQGLTEPQRVTSRAAASARERAVQQKKSPLQAEAMRKRKRQSKARLRAMQPQQARVKRTDKRKTDKRALAGRRGGKTRVTRPAH